MINMLLPHFQREHEDGLDRRESSRAILPWSGDAANGRFDHRHISGVIIITS
jgi:hypothetical protein